jgi:hypothetical protein
MASLTNTATSTGIPRSPISFPRIPSKSHQYPQSISLKQPHQQLMLAIKASNQSAPTTPTSSSSSSSSPGLYSAQKFELTAQNVDLVLEDVRPYLIADGGNVDVVSVQDGVVSLKLQGEYQIFFRFCILLIFIELGCFCFVLVELVQATSMGFYFRIYIFYFLLFKIWSFIMNYWYDQGSSFQPFT